MKVKKKTIARMVVGETTLIPKVITQYENKIKDIDDKVFKIDKQAEKLVDWISKMASEVDTAVKRTKKKYKKEIDTDQYELVQVSLKKIFKLIKNSNKGKDYYVTSLNSLMLMEKEIHTLFYQLKHLYYGLKKEGA